MHREGSFGENVPSSWLGTSRLMNVRTARKEKLMLGGHVCSGSYEDSLKSLQPQQSSGSEMDIKKPTNMLGRSQFQNHSAKPPRTRRSRLNI
jgi:hypothetical protein